MTNLINDSRHAFFGASCDVVVSKDADFRAKTEFMYHIHDIETKVLSLEEFENALLQWESDASLTVADLIKAASDDKTLSECIWEEEVEEGKTYYFLLSSTYLGYFDLLGMFISAKGNYTFFTKKPATLSNGTFVKELAKVANAVQTTLGADAEGRTCFQTSEIMDGKWAGRYWIIGEHVLQLTCLDKLFLSVIPVSYFDDDPPKEKMPKYSG